MKNFLLLILATILLNSCSTCKYTSTYSSNTHNRMTYGHSNDGITIKMSKSPYYVKPKKIHSSHHNPYVSHWWDR